MNELYEAAKLAKMAADNTVSIDDLRKDTINTGAFAGALGGAVLGAMHQNHNIASRVGGAVIGSVGGSLLGRGLGYADNIIKYRGVNDNMSREEFENKVRSNTQVPAVAINGTLGGLSGAMYGGGIAGGIARAYKPSLTSKAALIGAGVGALAGTGVGIYGGVNKAKSYAEAEGINRHEWYPDYDEDNTTNKTAKECLNMNDLQKTAMLAKEAAGFSDAVNAAKGYAQQVGQSVANGARYVGGKATNAYRGMRGQDLAGEGFTMGAGTATPNPGRPYTVAGALPGNGFTPRQQAEEAVRAAGSNLSRFKGRYAAGAGALAAAGAGYAGYQHYKEASEDVVYDEEIQMAKQAAELMYVNAMEEANEKLAFAEELFAQAEYAEKVAQDNGPALSVPYIDQVRTPAGAAIAGALTGGAIGGVVGAMRNGAAGAAQAAAVGAGSLAGAGALIAFVDQHRMARAQQLAAQ